MQFLTPFFIFAGVLSATVPLIIHLLNRERAQRLVFSTIRFIRMSSQANIQKHKLKKLILLIIRMLILGLLGFAFARPFFANQLAVTGNAGGHRHVVLILDNSFSMSYRNSLDRGKQLAIAVVDQLRPSDRATLIKVSNATQTAKPLDTEHDLLRTAIDSVSLTNHTTDFLNAIQSADELLQEVKIGQKEIVLISDLQTLGWERFIETDQLSPNVTIRFKDLHPEDTHNLAISDIKVPSIVLMDQRRLEVIVRVANFGNRDFEKVPLNLFINQKLIETKLIDVATHDITDVWFQVPLTDHTKQYGYAELPDDPIMIDNRRYFQFEGRQTIEVYCLNGEPNRDSRNNEIFYLQKATQALQKIVPIRFKSVSHFLSPDQMKDADLIILANVGNLTEKMAKDLKSFVKSGGSLFITGGDQLDLDNYTLMLGTDRDSLLPCHLVAFVGDAADRDQYRIIANLDYNHPIFQPFKNPNHGDFSTSRFYRYIQAIPNDDARILARFDDQNPTLIEKEYGQGRILCFTSSIDREWTDMPIHAVYLPFLHEAIKYLALNQSTQATNYLVGDVVELNNYNLPANTEVAIFNPQGHETRLKINELGSALYSDTELTGIYSVHASGAENRKFCVNPDSRESNLTSKNAEELTSMLTNPNQQPTEISKEMIITYQENTEKNQSLWWYAMLTLFALTIGEMFLANRV
ncbi:TPA: VWA domain-containing protein [Candidatus Poribacteria bacterium]|nr:VWA domain-containing protein [Candidatus Poribacteria bacterium]HIB88847.1 VWA domain-containing protein [Candidatus Poribacteria bacterium]HIC03541.1 VWA domain-containing protein [Candidatus Poribacteria bacterium]HIM09445.1 VWA domain-containing protein [Candidatus Poribacteria bacterium]HIN29358.1 VWA domain-containing protein [Candidatus Poribacteria bacterium]